MTIRMTTPSEPTGTPHIEDGLPPDDKEESIKKYVDWAWSQPEFQELLRKNRLHIFATQTVPTADENDKAVKEALDKIIKRVKEKKNA